MTRVVFHTSPSVASNSVLKISTSYDPRHFQNDFEPLEKPRSMRERRFQQHVLHFNNSKLKYRSVAAAKVLAFRNSVCSSVKRSFSRVNRRARGQRQRRERNRVWKTYSKRIIGLQSSSRSVGRSRCLGMWQCFGRHRSTTPCTAA